MQIPADQISKSLDANGGTVSVPVTAAASCAWTAVSGADFVTITENARGTGNATVHLAVAANTGPARTAAVTIATTIVTVSQAARACTYAVSPASLAAGSNGGSLSLSVTTGDGCAWTATTDDRFLSVGDGAERSGSGQVTVIVAANSGAARSGQVLVAGQVVPVSQLSESCSFAVSPPSVSVGTAAASITVTVTTTASCSWTTALSGGFVAITDGVSGTGSGAVQLAIAANSGAARTATLTVGGQVVTITQAGTAACAYTLGSVPTVPAAGGTVPIAITTDASCSWTATTTSSFLSFAGATSGTGTGSVMVTVASNAAGTSSRSGSVTIGNRSVFITQAPGENCVRIFGPSPQLFDQNGGTQTMSVSAEPLCTWTAVSGAGFVTLSPGATGAGDGSFMATVAANGSGVERQTTVRAGGREAVVMQSPAPPADATFFAYHSDAGDYIGQGVSYVHTLSSGTWTATADAAHNHVSIRFTNFSTSPAVWWYLDFAAPNGQVLTPGTYENARRYPFQPPAQPGLDVTGNGRGCNTLTGRFVVVEAVYGAGNTVARFRATFEQHCEGAAPALTGETLFIANP